MVEKDSAHSLALHPAVEDDQRIDGVRALGNRFPLHTPDVLPVGEVYSPTSDAFMMYDGRLVQAQPFFVHREISREEYYAYWPRHAPVPRYYRFYEISTD
jgi:hypothetical protein